MIELLTNRTLPAMATLLAFTVLASAQNMLERFGPPPGPPPGMKQLSESEWQALEQTMQKFHAEVKALHDRFTGEIKAVLTTEQSEKLDALEAPMRERGHPRHRPPSTNGAAFHMPLPPPPIPPLVDVVYFKPKLSAWKEMLDLSADQLATLEAMLLRHRQEALNWIDNHEPPHFLFHRK